MQNSQLFFWSKLREQILACRIHTNVKKEYFSSTHSNPCRDWDLVSQKCRVTVEKLKDITSLCVCRCCVSCFHSCFHHYANHLFCLFSRPPRPVTSMNDTLFSHSVPSGSPFTNRRWVFILIHFKIPKLSFCLVFISKYMQSNSQKQYRNAFKYVWIFIV